MDKLVIEHLSKAFGQTGVLHDVSFTVRDGEFLSILGPSGCGKTTILRILIGLEKPDSGRILKDGQDITGLPSAERKMGIVFQNYALFENMSVLRNVEYALLKSADEICTQFRYDNNAVTAAYISTEELLYTVSDPDAVKKLLVFYGVVKG